MDKLIINHPLSLPSGLRANRLPTQASASGDLPAPASKPNSLSPPHLSIPIQWALAVDDIDDQLLGFLGLTTPRASSRTILDGAMTWMVENVKNR